MIIVSHPTLGDCFTGQVEYVYYGNIFRRFGGYPYFLPMPPDVSPTTQDEDAWKELHNWLSKNLISGSCVTFVRYMEDFRYMKEERFYPFAIKFKSADDAARYTLAFL